MKDYSQTFEIMNIKKKKKKKILVKFLKPFQIDNLLYFNDF